MTKYIVGAVALFRAQFYVGGVLTDPTNLSISVKTGTAGTVTTYNYPNAVLTKNAVGDYTAAIPITEAGHWQYKWVSTGTAAGAQQSSIDVDPQAF